MKAVVSIITCMPDIPTTNFMTWDMNQEMLQSGLVEIGCHTHRLHNLDGRNGSITPDGTNGIQRLPEESDSDFCSRVLEDIQTSYDRILEELGTPPTCFAYPFGVAEPDAEELIHDLFPVTLMTRPATADLADGLYNLPRYTITMEKELSSLLR